VAKGNWLLLGGGIGGMAHRIDVLELVSTPPLANGIVIWCGRFAIPNHMSLKFAGPEHKLTLEDGRSGIVWLLEMTEKEATFCGRLS
jgi:hypothetical protein